MWSTASAPLLAPDPAGTCGNRVLTLHAHDCMGFGHKHDVTLERCPSTSLIEDG
jgi:hypothetical protein